MVLKHHIYEADALQLSTSKEARCNLFLGADNKLVEIALKEGINAINIEEEPEKALNWFALNNEYETLCSLCPSANATSATP